uniref:Choice-of-anchor D domain-containing protein n=1 Tax=Ignavibacterium album TaxID=591197 RepID=A0A7V3E778_9BACT
MSNKLISKTFITLLFVLFIITGNSFAQLTGTKTIPGDYATIAAAIADLNTQGVGSGGVTFNVAAGYTESITAPLTITATGTSSNPIIFQKSGAGTNPQVTRTDAGTLATSTIGGAGDAIIRLEGTDYITFDGIDVIATDQGIEYGYLTHKPSGTDGCQFVIIKNCNISLTKGTSGYVIGIYIGNGTTSTSSATGVTVTATSGINSNITITGNTIQNVHAGIYVRGSSATGFYDSDVTIGQSGAGNTITNFGGGSATTTYGVYFIYVNNPTVAYNTITSASHGSTLYGIFYSTVTGNVVGSNNSFNLANTSASSTTQYIYNSNTVTSETFDNNTFAAGTISSTGTVYLIYASSGTPNKSISGNQVSGAISRTGASGSFYCYYNFGSPASGTETLANNNFSNISVSGTSSLYGIYTNTATGQNRLCYNNTVSNLTGGTGSTYGIYALSTTSNQVYNNTVSNITAGGTVYSLYFSGTNPVVYNNLVYNISTNGTALYGIYNSGSGTTNCYKNQVYNLTCSNASATLYGFYITTGTANYVYNNFVSDLKTPSSGSTTGLAGMYISGGTSIGLYYNTIFLNASSTGTNFGSSGIYASTTPTVDLRNNVVVNLSTPAGTGLTVAYRRSTTTLTTYSNNSNANDFYAGTPSATNLIYYDGTNSDQTIAAYKTRVSPRDANSFSENPSFVNSTTAPYDLHINPSIATQLESGGVPVTTPITITDDFDGNTRNVTTPDVGADEFTGTPLDLTAPLISYTPLLNTSSTSARTLVASISDPSGVPTSGIGLPVLYWKINSGGTWAGATATYLSGNNYQFSFGSGVAVGDTVFYYVVAQDNATTPNVGAFPSTGAGGFTANPPAASTPPTNPYGYLVTQTSLSGNYTVGTSLFNHITGRNIYFEKVSRKVMKEVWVANPRNENKDDNRIDEPVIYGDSKSGSYKMMEVEEVTWIPMENGLPYNGELYVKKNENPELAFPEGVEGVYSTITAAIADLNLRGVAGNVNFLLTDANYSVGETYPIIVNITNENLPSSTKKVTLKPNTGVTATISGNSATGIFVSYGVDYFIIDGSNSGGTDRSLTIENTSTSTNHYVVGIFNNGIKGAQNNTLKNCVIRAGSNSAASWCVVLNYSGGDYDNTTIQNNEFQRAYTGMQFVGVATGITNGGLVSQNTFGNDADSLSVGNVGVVLSYIDGLSFSENNIKNIKVSTNPKGIVVSTSTLNTSITRNLITGIVYTGTGGYGGKGIDINTGSSASNLTIANNMLTNIRGDGWSVLSGDAIVGIRVLGTTGGLKIYYNSVNLYGNISRSGATTDRSASIYFASTATDIDLRNNILVNSLDNTTGVATAYAISSDAANTAFTNINNNDYFVAGPEGVLGFLGSNQATLAAWQTATGQDANSINLDPKFNSDTDLHINPAFNNVDAKAVYLAAVPVDFDGQARNATTPDIGADEYTYVPPAVDDPTGVTANAASYQQINVAFTPNSSNNNVVIVYNLTGTFTTPTGTPTVGGTLAGGEVLYIGTNSPYNHTGLTGATTYYYKLFSYNGSNYSPGVAVNATTPPAPLFPPFTQNFEGTFPPTNWTRFTGLLSDTSTLTSTTLGWVQDDWRNITTPVNKAAKLNIWSTTTKYWLVTPPIDLGSGSTDYQLEFDLTLNAFGTSNPPGTSGVDDKFAVVISTDGGTTWLAANTLRLWDNAGSPYVYNNINYLGEHIVLNLGAYSGIVRIGFYGESTVSNADNDLMVDNVAVNEVPTTPLFTITPASKDFGTVIAGNSVSAIFTISNTGAGTLTINSGGITLTGTNADQFNLGSITYPINLNTGESTQITVNFAPTSAGSKSANLQIVHNAPGSPAVVPLTGNALPLGTLFEDFTGTAFPPDGWLAVNNDGGANNWFRSTSKFNSAPASAASAYESSTLRNDDWLISPKVSVSAGDSLIFFSSIQSSTYPEVLVIKVGTTADPNATWTNLDSVVQSSTSWIRRAYSLSAFAGQNVYIAFVNRGLDEFYLYIDDVQGPVKYVPAVDLAFQDFYQSTGLPVPRSGEKFSDYKISMNTENTADYKPILKLGNNGLGLRSTNTNNTLLVESNNTPPFELNNVQLKGVIKNIGLNSASYNLNWNVSGTSQTPYSGPTITSGSVDTATLTYNPSATGTFLTSGNIVVTGDEVPGNDNAQFRMRVYPDTYTRTIYDRGDNVVDTWVGWGSTTIRMKAGVRFTAPEQIKLAGVDVICRTEAVSSGDFEIQVRAAGDSAGVPGAVLYTQVYTANDYFAGAGDYIFFPFGNDAPTIASGSDYWITIKAPLGVAYPGAVHNTGFTSGRSFFEGNVDSTLWFPLVISSVEYAWLVRAVHVPVASTFQLSVAISNGWNMVSVPGQHPVDQNVTTWWSGKDPAANVFKFQGSYQPVTTVQPGLGYWMKHLGANTYNTGDEWPSGGINVVAHDPLNAAAGWNLIGGYEFLAPTAALTTNPSGLISGFVYGYTPGSGYQVASNLVPGYGYWVKLTAAGQININPGPKANFKLSDFIADDFGKIIITDNAGKSYTLYVAQGKQANRTPLDFFELPPVPFTDMFDVRYTSGRFVEDFSSALKTIQMQGVEYPVRIRVEGIMIRITDETGKQINERLKSGEEITISNSQISKLNVMSDIIPDRYSLEQNYPNPFNPTTTIEFSLPEDVENVRLTIYNALGEKVAELINGKMEAGRYRYQWNASEVSTGLYIYELKTNKFSSVKKMMLLK